MDMAASRERMVEQQLERRGIHDTRVLESMRRVPREEFVPESVAAFAYDDSALPIAECQTISQPYVVALMAEAAELDEDDRVLEIGTGSGYGAAVLGQIASEVYTIERHHGLADTARDTLARLGYDNVRVGTGDGSEGWAEHAPYHAIVVTAGGRRVPPPLLEQLAFGGRLVIPIGPEHGAQQLTRLRRREDGEPTEERLGAVRFVSLIGSQA